MTATQPHATGTGRKSSTWPLANDDPTMIYLRSLLAERPIGICTDIDGTISATAPTVDAAVLLPGIRELLAELATRFDVVATISGRAVLDQRRMVNVPGVWHVGHHGYEWEEAGGTEGSRRVVLWSDAASHVQTIATAMDEIEAELAPQVPGLWMERKGVTGGVHWRLAEDTDGAASLCIPVVERVAAAHHVRTRGGKYAIELFPPVITHKGEGLKKVVERHRLRAVLYFGDDISDTDAFRAIRALREAGQCEGLSIGVLHDDSPRVLKDHADMLVEGTDGVWQLLCWLLDQMVTPFACH